MKITHHVRIIGLSLMLSSSGAVLAAEYPERAISIVVPQAAGGASDVVTRIVAQKMASILGQAMVVENRPGAGGNIGIGTVARSAPDGYTVLMNVSSAHLVNPFLYKDPGFDPQKDFVPVAPLATGGMVLVAAPSFPANNVAELIALAKSKPNEFTYASAGNGTLNHLLGEMFGKAADVDMLHVPYRGAAAAATDVMSGRVSVAFQAVASSLSQIQAGKLKVLGVANPNRIDSLPDVPTIGEVLPGFGETPWYGLFVPTGTPKNVVEKLHSAVAQAVQDEKVKSSLAAQGAQPYPLSQPAFIELIATELPRWKGVVEASGAHVD